MDIAADHLQSVFTSTRQLSRAILGSSLVSALAPSNLVLILRHY